MSSKSPELPPALRKAPIAHRGLHDRVLGVIENSRAAVRAAASAGYGIEIDIQRSSDGEAMVFHDDDLKRLTGETGRVADRTAAALGAIGLLGGSETIPTLGEILAIVAGRVPLLIEVKDQDGALGTAVGPLEARVAELMADYDGQAAVMSFNPHSVAALAAAAPALPRGLTAGRAEDTSYRALADDRRAGLAGMADFDRVGATFVSFDHRGLACKAVTRLRARGVPILTWTIRSPAEEAAARRIAVNVTFEGYAPAIPVDTTPISPM